MLPFMTNKHSDITNNIYLQDRSNKNVQVVHFWAEK